MDYSTLISAKELLDNLDEKNLVIIDCRYSLFDKEAGRKNYQTDHIPRSVYAHMDEDLSGEIIAGKTGRHPLPSIDKVTALFSSWGIDENVQVVAYDDKSGALAARLWWMLRWLGHEKVAVLNGGWNYWYSNNFPVSSDIPTNEPKEFKADIRENFTVDIDFVEQMRQRPELVLVDSRTSERYQGLQEPVDPVAGHIPGAINAPHPENINSEGLLHQPETLRGRFGRILGGKPVENAVFYCGSGVTACANLLALAHAGMGNAKLYPGSWSEWITRHH
jgi:thiosulfate/3-mercaptopyruvate sulfurtransferase